MLLQNKYKWSPKHIGILAGLAFFVITIFYSSEFKIRFLDWTLGGLILVLLTMFFLLKGSISKQEITIIFLPNIWLLYAYLTSPFVYSLQTHLSALNQAAIIILIVEALTICIFSRPKLSTQIVTITVLAWSFFSLVCFVAWYSGYLTYRDTKFAGMFVNRNEFAINTVFLVSVALFFSRNRIVLFFSVFICALLIGISNSTTGCLVLVFALFYPYFLTARFWKKILAIFSGILLVFAAYNLLPEVQKRINSVGILLTEPQELDGSVFLRAHFILEGIRIALENPLCGIGVDNSKFFLFDPRYANSHGWYSHNNYVEMLLNVGFPGFLLYYGPLVFVFIRVKPKHKFYIEIRTFALIFFISGISSVQYNFIPSVFLYLLTLFLFKYYSDRPLEKVLQPG